MKKALVLSLLALCGLAPADTTPTLLRSREETYPDTKKRSRKPKLTTSQKRAVYIYPKVIKALNNATRREILAFLLENSGKQVPFTRLKQQIPGLKNASLSRHLNILQRAWLVERRVEFGSPRTAENLYYSFYTISKFGEQLLSTFGQALTKSTKLIPCSKDKGHISPSS